LKGHENVRCNLLLNHPFDLQKRLEEYRKGFIPMEKGGLFDIVREDLISKSKSAVGLMSAIKIREEEW
jgi:hypothetical protein